jgi:hypothetical protein
VTGDVRRLHARASYGEWQACVGTSVRMQSVWKPSRGFGGSIKSSRVRSPRPFACTTRCDESPWFDRRLPSNP